MPGILAKPQFRSRQVSLGYTPYSGGERDCGIAGLQHGIPILVRLVPTNPLLVIHSRFVWMDKSAVEGALGVQVLNSAVTRSEEAPHDQYELHRFTSQS